MAALTVALFLHLNATGAELTVFAAASLSDALKKLAAAHSQATGVTVRFNFGASGPLARQIKEGAPADVFISADETRMDLLDREGLVAPGSRRNLLSNTLVLVVPSDTRLEIQAMSDLIQANVRRIGMGQTETVPAGAYARKYLESVELWQQLEKKVVPLENVRAVLAAVEMGNVDAGFVYKTDARTSRSVKVAVEVSRDQGPQITYPAAVVKTSKRQAEAYTFLQFLQGAEASKIFREHGFVVLASNE
jgi:molybdate transport system substrate-binding protein